MAFPLSDATALLMRLDMEDFQPKGNPSLKDRFRELAEVYSENLSDSSNNLFYDFHALLALQMGNQKPSADKLRQGIKEQVDMFKTEKGAKSYNCMVADKIGFALADSVTAFAEQDFDKCVQLLHPIRFECQELLGGSHAQKDVSDLMLLRAAIKSRYGKFVYQLLEPQIPTNFPFCSRGSNFANQLLEERIARCSGPAMEIALNKTGNGIDRLRQRIIANH